MESNYLPLGSIVRLKDGDMKLMIISRFPLYDNNGKVGYFEYSACVYPTGHTNEENYFFNKEDIAEVFFEGYVDESEEEAQKFFEEQLKTVTVPHFRVDDMDNRV